MVVLQLPISRMQVHCLSWMRSIFPYKPMRIHTLVLIDRLRYIGTYLQLELEMQKSGPKFYFSSCKWIWKGRMDGWT